MILVILTVGVGVAYLDAGLECAKDKKWRHAARDLTISSLYFGMAFAKFWSYKGAALMVT